MKHILPVVAGASLVVAGGAVVAKPLPSPNVVAHGPVEKQVDALLKKLTLAQKVLLLSGTKGFFTHAIPQAGIPSLQMSDGPVGVKTRSRDTMFPAGPVLASAWDPALAVLEGTALGRDARARGVNIILAPGVNIYREPQCGRNFEYFGEDPFLAGRIAAAYIRGVQSQGVAACVKHYAVNEQETLRGSINMVVSRRAMHEIYLPPFRAAVVHGHVWTMMNAYNKVNGQYCTANRYLDTHMLRKRWHFKGILMSDWGATHATARCLAAGLDLQMPDHGFYNMQRIAPLLKSKKISMHTLNAHVRRILRLIVTQERLHDLQKKKSISMNDPFSNAVVEKVAAEGTVLLKNRHHLLPLGPDVHSVVVLGPNASPAVTGGGGSSYRTPLQKPVSMLAAVRAAAGGSVKVIYFPFAGMQAALYRENSSRYGKVAATGKPGLAAEYFNNPTLSGKPTLRRVDRQINFNWKAGTANKKLTNDQFSARWRGTITPAKTGGYFFTADSDDGARVYLNGKKIIDTWWSHAVLRQTVTRQLAAGKTYRLRVEYNNLGGLAEMHFGWGPVGGLQLQLPAAEKRAVQQAGAVIVCVGFNPGLESEGMDRTYHLPPGQGALIRAAAALNRHTVVVLNAGGNVAMHGWYHSIGGLVDAFYPGVNGNTSVAGILFGKINPSGHLCDSYEKRFRDAPAFGHFPGHAANGGSVHLAEGIYVGYRWFDKKKIAPRFPFGYGLSYTSFAISKMGVKSAGAGRGRRFTVSVRVTNTGKVAGAQVVQVYVRPINSPVPRTVQQLKGFARVMLQPGQSRVVHMVLNRRSFAYYDTQAHRWRVQPKNFTLAVGDNSRHIAVTKRIHW